METVPRCIIIMERKNKYGTVTVPKLYYKGRKEKIWNCILFGTARNRKRTHNE
jgi:hypothetical protein